MNAGKLSIGDEVYLIGEEPIKRTKVKSIEFKGKPVKTVKKGQEVGIQFGSKVKNGTEVYLIRKSA